MFDLGTLSAALGSAQAAGTIIKSLAGMKNSVDINAKAIELQGVILSLQADIGNAIAAQAQLAQENQKLKDELAEVEAFRGEAEHYKLFQPWPGIFAYGRKESMDRSVPPHYLCAHCYQQNKKSILQQLLKNHWLHFACSSCQASLQTEARGPLPLQYAD